MVVGCRYSCITQFNSYGAEEQKQHFITWIIMFLCISYWDNGENVSNAIARSMRVLAANTTDSTVFPVSAVRHPKEHRLLFVRQNINA